MMKAPAVAVGPSGGSTHWSPLRRKPRTRLQTPADQARRCSATAIWLQPGGHGVSTIPYNTKLPADVSKESQQLSGAVLRWRDTARLSPSLQLVLEQKCHQGGQVPRQHWLGRAGPFDLLGDRDGA